MLKGLGSQRLLALFCAGAMLLNFPLLALSQWAMTVHTENAVSEQLNDQCSMTNVQ